MHPIDAASSGEEKRDIRICICICSYGIMASTAETPEKSAEKRAEEGAHDKTLAQALSYMRTMQEQNRGILDQNKELKEQLDKTKSDVAKAKEAETLRQKKFEGTVSKTLEELRKRFTDEKVPFEEAAMTLSDCSGEAEGPTGMDLEQQVRVLSTFVAASDKLKAERDTAVQRFDEFRANSAHYVPHDDKERHSSASSAAADIGPDKKRARSDAETDSVQRELAEIDGWLLGRGAVPDVPVPYNLS